MAIRYNSIVLLPKFILNSMSALLNSIYMILQAIRVPLMECVERTQAVAKAMAEKQWELAVQLRGRSFARNLETYKMLTRLKPPKESFDAEGKPVVSILLNFISDRTI